MPAYYNENDPFAAAWLRELISDGLIAEGEVDERSIEDVTPGDLAGYTQHHFFAGVGVWSLALRQIGWPDDRAIWTGSCPCQPFSAAGKAGGFADERHLWPAFYHLIGECRPSIVVGEQVASKDGLAWLDLVSADMEGAGYAFGAVDTCAAGFGAPHIRQRLYFGAHRLADADGRNASAEGLQRSGQQRQQPQDGSARVGMADASDADGGCGECGTQTGARSDQQRRRGFASSGIMRGMADADERKRGRLADGEGCKRNRAEAGRIKSDGIAQSGSDICDHGRPGPVNGLWRNVDWLFCRDGKWRPVEPGTFPLADAGTFRNRVAELRGAGNAINLAQAVGFLEAFRESVE